MKTFSDILESYNVNYNVTTVDEPIYEVAHGNFPTNVKTLKGEYFFENIVTFSVTNDVKNNDLLLYLQEFVRVNNKIKLYNFVCNSTKHITEDNVIKVFDGITKLTFNTTLNNANTIIIIEGTALNHDNCIAAIKQLSEYGFLVINPIEGSLIANNKYKSAELLSKHNIPQPRYTLIEQNDLNSDNPAKSLVNKLSAIYPDILSMKDEDIDELVYVVKILDGFGGTGISKIKGKRLLGVLQTYFAVKPSEKFLIQRFEKCTGGDIRVHVITTRTEQKIIATMKRVKIDGDFRSNVSLGASTETVKITKEQEEIAKDVARVSGLPWCAVDLMELEPHSNPEIGDNVVIEYNNSPGVNGISQIIGTNILNLIFEQFKPSNIPMQKITVGYTETATLTDGNNKIEIETVMDTGNTTLYASLCVNSLEKVSKNIININLNGKKYSFKYDENNTNDVLVGGKTVEKRYVINIDSIKIGTRILYNIPVTISVVTNRLHNKLLLNSELLRRFGFIVDSTYGRLLSKDTCKYVQKIDIKY